MNKKKEKKTYFDRRVYKIDVFSPPARGSFAFFYLAYTLQVPIFSQAMNPSSIALLILIAFEQEIQVGSCVQITTQLPRDMML